MKHSYVFAVWAVFLELFCLGVSSNSVTNVQWFKKQSHGIPLPPESNETSAFLVRSRLECTLSCRAEDRCIFFFYNNVSKRCLLFPSAVPIDANMASGWAYFALTSADGPSSNGTRQERYAVDHESMTSYRVVTSPLLSWLAARDACNDSNEILAVLEPVERATFLARFLRENKKALMGENSELICFVGASRPANAWNSNWPASGPDFVWLDGQPVNLTTTASFWAPGRPNNLDENDNALMIKATVNFRWDDYDDFEKNCYICQRQWYSLN